MEERFDCLPHIDGAGVLLSVSRSCCSGIEDSTPSCCGFARVLGGGGEAGLVATSKISAQ